MNYACEWVKGAISAQTAEPLYSCEWVKKNWGKEFDEMAKPFPCESIEDYFVTEKLGVTIEPMDESEKIFETNVSDIQSDIVIDGDNITGTLKFLDSGDIAEYWGSGNFIAIQFDDIKVGATSIKVGLNPSYGSGLVEIINDPDKNGVFKITDPKAQRFLVVSTDGEYTSTQTYNLSNLVCEK